MSAREPVPRSQASRQAESRSTDSRPAAFRTEGAEEASAEDSTETASSTVHGRGAGFNPHNRFERLEFTSDEAPPERVPTVLLRDDTRTVLAQNQSPDVPFTYSLNPYRGCEHGCIYCYARPSHEYLGFSAGLDFETRILVKETAPTLLRAHLMKPSWKPQVIALSGNTDPYQPIERKLGITRRCLEVLCEFRNPVQIITKNALVQRDIDLLAALAEHRAASVAVSITTLDSSLVSKLEPRTSSPQRRLETLAALNAAGVPASVLIAPVIPGLTDHEIPAILQAAKDAGAHSAGYVMLRLPRAVAPLFEDWLERQFPDRKDKILHKLEDMRGGRLNDPRFGSRMRGEGVVAQQISDLFKLSERRFGLRSVPRRGPDGLAIDPEGMEQSPYLSTAAFRRPGEQLRLL